MTVGEIGGVICATPDDRWAVEKMGCISTDTRSIGKGDFFLALRGENFDGHKFVGLAIERGAGGLIIENGVIPDPTPQIPVLKDGDTLYAYGEIARHVRKVWGGKVLAMSGSVGKTTTRRLLASALSSHLKTLEPEKNFNNLIGVPQTLLKLEADHEVAVLELGMNMPGELARLAEIAAPDVSALTRIGMTHVGMFKSLDELIEAKLSLFAGTPEGNPLVVNAACSNSTRAIGRVSDKHPIITFRSDGMDTADIAITNVGPAVGGLGYQFDLTTPRGRLERIELKHFGRHHLEDVACAAAMLHAGGYDPAWIVDGMKNFRTERYRGEIRQVGAWRFILDCYNAAPDSMRASLQSLREIVQPSEGNLVLVLADMLELGTHSRSAHEAMLEYIRPLGPNRFFGLGPESSRLADALRAEGWTSAGFDAREGLVAALKESLAPGDTVFFKGSHGFALEKVAHELAPEAGVIEIGH